MNSVPQAAATTFSFSSVRFFFFYAAYPSWYLRGAARSRVAMMLVKVCPPRGVLKYNQLGHTFCSFSKHHVHEGLSTTGVY